MNPNDPERLSALSSNAELREVMRAGQERLPDAAALERLRTRLDSALSTAGTPSPASATVFAPAVAATIVSSVIVAAVVHFGVSHSSAPAPQPSLPLVTASASGEMPVIPAPVEPPSPTAPTLASAAPPVLARKERAVPSAVPVEAAPAPSAVVSTPSELELIGGAGRALKSDPVRALSLVSEHQKLYPAGALAEEREVIAIEALARLGNASLARARADRFSLAFPRSAHLARVSRAIEGTGAQKSKPPVALDER